MITVQECSSCGDPFPSDEPGLCGKCQWRFRKYDARGMYRCCIKFIQEMNISEPPERFEEIKCRYCACTLIYTPDKGWCFHYCDN